MIFIKNNTFNFILLALFLVRSEHPNGCNPTQETRKFTGLAGFLLSDEVLQNAVTLDNLCSKFYSNFRLSKKVTAVTVN